MTDVRDCRAPERDEGGGFGVARRFYRAFAPVLGALVLDFADFATIGPFGVFLGFPLGAAIGWWLAGMYRLHPYARGGIAVLAGGYCMAPFTNFLPVATILSALARFLEDPVERPSEKGNQGT